MAIEHGPNDTSVIIGGRFVSITDGNGNKTWRHRLALMNLPDGSVDQSWEANASAKVTTIDLHNDRLFVGGDFTTIDGHNVAHLAELKMSTSTVNPAFSFTWGGTLARRVVSALVSPDGTRLIVGHRATSINGNSMRGTAVFNISNPAAPSLTPHRMATNNTAYTYYQDIQDAEMSPDGKYIALVQGTATASDYVHLIPTTEASGQYKWRHFMRDSSFGVAVTDAAVYVGGHFCKVDEGPGPTDVMAPKGLDTCTGVFYNGGAWRTQLAALSLNDGTPLAWNPGNDSYRGASFLKATARGLLVGYDGERTNYFHVGAFAFFDFGGPFIPPPAQTTLTCAAAVDANGQVSLSWNDVGVGGYEIRRDGTALTTTQAATFVDTPPAGDHTYVIRTTINGAQTDSTCSPDPVVVQPPPPAELTCTAVVDANNQVTLNWNDIGIADYVVRDGNTWLATVQTLTYTDNPAQGDHTYVIRTRKNGVLVDTTCTPDPVVIGVTPPPPAEVLTCTAVVGANNQVTLNWNDIGIADYVVRDGNTWLATVQTLTYTDNPAQGDHTYVIRTRKNGVLVDTTCTPDPVVIGVTPPPPAELTCTAAVDANNAVTLTWNDTGAQDYTVRVNDAWLTTLQNTTYTTNPTPGTYTYVIRAFTNDVQVGEATCTPNPVVIDVVPPPPAELTCTAAVDANNAVTLTWNDTGAQDYTVRVNDAWLTTLQNTTYTTNPTPGTYTYVIRAFTNDVQVGEATCTPNPIVIAQNAGLVCTVTRDAAGGVVIDWTQNVSDYYAIRLDGNWLATTDNQTFTYTHVNPPAGNHTYQVRYKQNGVKTDVNCTPDPIAI